MCCAVVGEENSLESSVEVDEEEVQELVAAAKDLPCDDIAIYEQVCTSFYRIKCKRKCCLSSKAQKAALVEEWH